MERDYIVLLDKDKENKVYLSIENKNERNKYEVYLNEISPFWLRNMKYFKNDFNHFYDILELVFIKKSKDIQWEILEETEQKVELNICYNPGLIIFGFDIIIELPREGDRIEKLIKKVEKLEKENKEILKKLDDKYK
tara:strand:+ start:2143 stop:2553 length:411 start_codon:yes stop_codon:yes gene_type:complete